VSGRVHGIFKSDLACFLLVRDGRRRVFLRLLHVVGRLFDVVFDLVHHLALRGCTKCQNRMLVLTPPPPPTHTRTHTHNKNPALLHLRLHLHGQVLEQFVQVSDALLQLQDLVVPGLDLVQGLPGGLGVGQDLETTESRFCVSCIISNRQTAGDQWWKKYSLYFTKTKYPEKYSMTS